MVMYQAHARHQQQIAVEGLRFGTGDVCDVIIIIIWIGVQFRSLPPGSTAASVAYCTIPCFLNIPTLVARSLSRPQPAVAP